MYKYSYVLIHEIRSGMWGKFTYLEDQYLNTQKMMTDISKYLKLGDDELNAILQRDKYLSAEDCLEINLIDEIL